MRFLVRTTDARETARVLSILESGGIPCHTQPDRVHIGTRAVFVVFDRHYDDALQLLLDSSHKVSDPVDLKHYQEFEETFDHRLLLRYAIIWLLVSVIALVIAIFVVLS